MSELPSYFERFFESKSLIERYLNLRRELEKKYDEMVMLSAKEISRQLGEAIRKELDEMELAIKNGDLIKANYHESKVKALFDLILT